MALGFIDVDLVAMGNYQSVKRAIDAGAGNNIMSNNDLMRQINDLDASNVWAVGRFDALANTGQLPQPFSRSSPRFSGSRRQAMSMAASAASSRPKRATKSPPRTSATS